MAKRDARFVLVPLGGYVSSRDEGCCEEESRKTKVGYVMVAEIIFLESSMMSNSEESAARWAKSAISVSIFRQMPTMESRNPQAHRIGVIKAQLKRRQAILIAREFGVVLQ